MATKQQLLNQLATDFPEYWAWLQSKPRAMEKVRNIASQGGTWGKFSTAVTGLKSYQTFLAGGTGDETEPPVEEPLPEEVPVEPPVEEGINEDIRGMLLTFLQENELPSSLMGFIEDALAQHWSYGEIIARLRQTPEYLAAYPENQMRLEAGLAWWPEARIREYRDTANRIIKSYLGVFDPAGFKSEIANLIAKGVDLGEWERRIQTHAAFLQWGPAVKQALSLELGYEVPDERAWAFMNPDIPTPELDLAYKRAMMRGQPAVLGFGIRPSEEADILMQFGFSPEKAFEGYQGIASELPRTERMKSIESYINGQTAKTPTNPLGEASYGLLFRALMMRDTEAFNVLQGMLARETARFQAGGGPVSGGLLNPELR